MKKLIIISLMIGLILIALAGRVSADMSFNPFDTRKSFETTPTDDMSQFIKDDFNSKYGVIRLSETILWITSDKIAEYSLTDNTDYCLSSCEAQGRVTLYKDSTIFDDVKFTTLWGRDTNIKKYEYDLFDGYEDVVVQVPIEWKEVCAKYDEKACWQEPSAWKNEIQQQEVWKAYDGRELPAGDYRWKIKGTKEPWESIDFIPIKNSKEFSEWATWQASFNVGLISYYNFETALATDVVAGRNNLTLTIATSGSVNGKVGKGLSCASSGYATKTNVNFPKNDESRSYAGWVNTTGTAGCFFGLGTIGEPKKVNEMKRIGNPTWQFANYGDDLASWSGASGWEFIVMTYDAGSNLEKFYMNGVNTANKSLGGSLITNTSGFSICNCPRYDEFLTATADEFGVWNRSLTASEITDMYNGGVGLTYTSTFSSLTATQSFPQDNYNTSNSTMMVGCNFSSFGQNITSVKLNVYNSSNYQTYTNTESSLNTLSYNKTWNVGTLNDDSYLWACYLYADSGVNASTTNRTFTIHTTSPILTLYSPLYNLTTTSLPINYTLNFSATDLTTLSSCWFNTTFNSTNTYFPCNTLKNVSINNIASTKNQTIFYGANDTFNNVASGSTPIHTYYIIQTATATNPITEGGLSSHTLTLNMSGLTSWGVSAWLIWNNNDTGVVTQTNLSNDLIRFEKSFVVPTLNLSSNLTNWTWFYNITGNPNVTAWNVSGNQTLVGLAITECGAGMTTILNYTLYDEKAKTISDGTNATIEVDMTLTSVLNTSQTFRFYGKKTGSPNYLICLPNGALNNTNFSMDSTSSHSYQSHVVEYHYIENFTLSSSTAPQTIKLYDLAGAESTSFLITYQDENYLYEQDAVVDIWRYYVGDGGFLSVEHGKTDAGGQTRAHLVTEDVIYKALVWKDGVLQYTSPEFVALCQATPCQINLRKSQSTNESFSDYSNIVYSYVENKTARDLTFTFATKDGSSTAMNLTITRNNQYENETISSQTLTTSGGSINAVVPLTYGNDTYKVTIYRDGQFFGQTYYNLRTTSKDIFGYTGIVLSAFAFLLLALMGISSGIAVIVLGLIGLTLMGMVQIFESGSAFGMSSAIIWLIVAGAIIIWKITNRRIS